MISPEELVRRARERCKHQRQPVWVASAASASSPSWRRPSPRRTRSCGFSVLSNEDYSIGRVVEATLCYGVETFNGRVCLQSVKIAPEGRKRYGFYCVDKKLAPGSLPRGFYVITVGVQREHLLGLRCSV